MSDIKKPELDGVFEYSGDNTLMFNIIHNNQEKILNYIEARFDELSKELARKE